MYKVTYYMNGSNTVLEVKYYPKENKRENRT